MAFLNLHCYSQALGRQVHVNVLLPQKTFGEGGFNAPEERFKTYPTLYLLHGAGDDNTIWMRQTAIERYAADKKIAVVMPDAGLSWYTDMKYGGDYFTFIADELPALCRDFFPRMSQKREDTFVAGLSMGGYGAFKLALRRPERFCCAASLSGALDVGRHNYQAYRASQTYSIFGSKEEFAGSENDLFALAQKLSQDKSAPKPRLFQWCGTEDFLYQDNLKMRGHLQSLGYELEWRQSVGNHSWVHWDKWIKTALDWMLPEFELLTLAKLDKNKK